MFIRLLLIIAVSLFLPLCSQAKTISLKSEPMVTVGILTNVPEVKIAAGFDYEISDISGKYPARTEITITNKDGLANINGKSTKKNRITAELKKQPANAKLVQYISVNGNSYRGNIEIICNGKKDGLTVINTLPLEEYLYGVIKNEIPTDWQLEAVKAQAVAARNYALSQKDRHKTQGFDVCPTTHCQVYGGQRSETTRAIEAVNQTRGKILTYNGGLVNAVYHSSSGGYTENSENVWATGEPYLRAVADFDQNSPNYKWEKEFTLAAFSEKLNSAGINIGTLKTIELSPLKKQPVNDSDRGVSGRVKKIGFVGTKGKASIDGNKFRTVFGLNSTLFDLKMNSDKKNKNAQNMIVITGFGLGHGVGMSQWGAKAMAEKAVKASDASKSEYYLEILKHYYKNTDIAKAY